MKTIRYISAALMLSLSLATFTSRADDNLSAPDDDTYSLRYTDGKLRIGAPVSDNADEAVVMSGFKKYFVDDTLSRSFRIDLVAKAYPLINGYSFVADPSQRLGGLMFFNTQTGVYNAIEAGKIFTNADHANVEPTFDAPERSLEIVRGLTPSTFRYAYEKDATGEAPLHYGFVAQQVERVMPEAVAKDSQGMRSIDPTAILAHALASVGELSAQVAETNFEMLTVRKSLLAKACYLKVADGESGVLAIEYFYAADTDGQIVVTDVAGNVLLSEECRQGRNMLSVAKRNSAKAVYLVSLLHKADVIQSIRVVK